MLRANIGRLSRLVGRQPQPPVEPPAPAAEPEPEVEVVQPATDESRLTANYLSNDAYQIGRHTYGHPKVYDWEEGTKLIIGDYTSIAEGVTILLGGNHRTDWVTTYPFPALKQLWPEAEAITGHPSSKGNIVIGNDVWIGFGATILSGVTIGDGAVIAAGSLVIKDVPPYAIAGGVPAQLLKYRFDGDTIDKLCQLRWWDWDEAKVRQNIALLCSPDITKLLAKG